MKNTMTIAVLLSLTAVAGLAATDAYAQSNSERIVAIDERTSDIEDDIDNVSGSVNSLATMVSAVQTTLADLATSIQGIAASITGVQTSVNGMAGDISTISSKISSMDSALTGISAIDARLTGIEGQIGSVQGSVDGLDTGDDPMTMQGLATISTRLEATNARIGDVLDRLELIEASLQMTNQKIDLPAPAPAPGGNTLLDGESELNVNTYHYVKHGDATTNRGPAYYELDMAFSCNKNVFLDTVDLIPVQNVGDTLDHVAATSDTMSQNDNTRAEAIDGGPTSTTNNNYVLVDNRDLYNNKFNTGATNFAELDVPVKFNNKLLRADETLKFTSVLFEGEFRLNNALVDSNVAEEYYGQLKGGFDTEDANDFEQLINGSTRDVNTPLYEINVEWVASETGITCSLNFGGAGVAPGLTVSQTLTYGVTTNKANADDALKPFKDTIDCSGDPVQINEITAGTTDTWRLAGFADVVLTLGSDTHTLKFDTTADTPVISNLNDVLPLYVGNEDLVISGTIPVKNLLLSLKYDTIPNASCTAVPDPTYQ